MFLRIALLVTIASIPILANGNGYWSTNGSKIIDSDGNQILFSGINWNGFESSNCVVDGLWSGLSRSYLSHVTQMKFAGFNVIRLPFCGTCVQDGVFPVTTGIDFDFNPDLKGLTTLDAMMKIIQSAASVGMRVILDYHRRSQTPPTGAPEDGVWQNESFSFQYWLDTWKSMAEKFKDERGVIGVDIWNEPHGGVVWTNDESNPFDFYTAAKTAGDAILSIQPNWLIFVEGIYSGDTWWGADLRGVRSLPLTLSVPHKLVHSAHDYGPVVFRQPWFNYSAGFPSNMPSVWDADWGYVHKEGIAPVWIGEFGSKLNLTVNDTINTMEYEWITSLVDYIFENKMSWAYFTWGPNSQDTGGVLENDWHTMNTQKLGVISKIVWPCAWSALRPFLNQTNVVAPPSLKSLWGLYFTAVVMFIAGSIVFLPIVQNLL